MFYMLKNIYTVQVVDSFEDLTVSDYACMIINVPIGSARHKTSNQHL